MAQSRVEAILSGTYTGRPLSRVEALLMSGGTGGSGSGSPGGITVPDTEYDFDAIFYFTFYLFYLSVKDNYFIRLY